MRAVWIALLLCLKSTSHAAEPSHCTVEHFKAKLVAAAPGLVNARELRFGDRRLVGLAVGDTPLADTCASAGNSRLDGRFCTWYLNTGRGSAWLGPRASFHWFYVPKPTSNSAYLAAMHVYGDPTTWAGVLERYAALLESEAGPMIACLADHRYLAFGCNGMKERGPAVFAALLALSGCSPARSDEITAALWPDKGGWVTTEDRTAVAELGAKLGAEKSNERLRSKLAEIFAR